MTQENVLMKKRPKKMNLITSNERSTLNTLIDSLQFLGFTDEWLSNQQLTDIALDGGFEEFDEQLEPDAMLTLLERLFVKSNDIAFGRWRIVCRGENPKRVYKFSRFKSKQRKGTVIIR